jgi:hypothetical protein
MLAQIYEAALSTLAFLPVTGELAYYTVLASIGSLIVWRVR